MKTELFELNAEKMAKAYPGISPMGWLYFEQSIYGLADRFADEYNGGYWRYEPLEFDATGELGMVIKVPMLNIELDNDDIMLQNPMNYAEGEANAETFAAVITSFALNQASLKAMGETQNSLVELCQDFNWLAKHGHIAGVDCKLFARMID